MADDFDNNSVYGDSASLTRAYEKELLGWVRKKLREGQEILKKEQASIDTQRNMNYIEGKQEPLRSGALSKVVDNRSKKIVLETASVLTDVRSIWNFETFDEKYKDQGTILNKLSRGWWKNSFADRKLQRTLMFSMAGGSGYVGVNWNPDLPGGGDIELTPLDPRDVIPIDPVYTDSIQDWRGVIARERVSIETLKARYPSKAMELAVFSGTKDPGPSKSSRLFSIFSSPMSSISGREGGAGQDLPGTVDLLRVWFKDDTIHTGEEPIQMGDPDTNWAYVVYPVGYEKPDGTICGPEHSKLYPRGRKIVCTPEVILSDGPNPDWHGLFPIVKFTLDPLPWTLLGSPLVSDLVPLQDGLNEALRGAQDGIEQWIKRGVVADKNAISSQNLRMIDTRKAGLKASLNPTAGEGFQIIDGPNLPTWYLDILAYYKNEMDEISGVKGLNAAMQAGNGSALAEGSDNAIDKIQETMSPLNRIRARSIEVSLGELAEMLKVGFFQYYTAKRRMQILGEDGMTLEDFDYDPGNMVPQETEGETTEERAKNHHRNFTFSIAPNSFLNISHATQKMLMMQLFRANGLDIFSLWEALDVPNVGPIPAETVPERMFISRKNGLQAGPSPELIQAQEAVQIMQAQLAMVQMQAALQGVPMGPDGAPPPMGGPPEQKPLSNNGVGSQGGRPPSGQQPPKMIVKNGPEGPRTVMSESGS